MGNASYWHALNELSGSNGMNLGAQLEQFLSYDPSGLVLVVQDPQADHLTGHAKTIFHYSNYSPDFFRTWTRWRKEKSRRQVSFVCRAKVPRLTVRTNRCVNKPNLWPEKPIFSIFCRTRNTRATLII